MTPTPVSMSSPTAPAVYTWEATNEAVAAKYGVAIDEIIRFDLNTSPAPPDLAARVLAGNRFDVSLSDGVDFTRAFQSFLANGSKTCVFGDPVPSCGLNSMNMLEASLMIPPTPPDVPPLFVDDHWDGSFDNIYPVSSYQLIPPGVGLWKNGFGPQPPANRTQRVREAHTLFPAPVHAALALLRREEREQRGHHRVQPEQARGRAHHRARLPVCRVR